MIRRYSRPDASLPRCEIAINHVVIIHANVWISKIVITPMGIGIIALPELPLAPLSGPPGANSRLGDVSMVGPPGYKLSLVAFIGEYPPPGLSGFPVVVYGSTP